MDNQPINQNPNPVFRTPEVIPPKSSKGPTIALVIVLLLIILGGIYFWMEKKGGYDYDSYGADAQTEAYKEQGSSDEISSIEADLNSTNFNNLDEGYTQIDSEFEAQ